MKTAAIIWLLSLYSSAPGASQYPLWTSSLSYPSYGECAAIAGQAGEPGKSHAMCLPKFPEER